MDHIGWMEGIAGAFDGESEDPREGLRRARLRARLDLEAIDALHAHDGRDHPDHDE